MSGESSISVLCACGKKLKAPASSVGKRARCPACKEVLVLNVDQSALMPTIGAMPDAPRAASQMNVAQSRQVRTRTALSNDDDGLSGLYDLAEQAESARVMPDAPQCPQCRSPWDKNAVLCTDCGYDSRTGKAISAASVAKPKLAAATRTGKKSGKPVDMMAPTGSFMAGIILSAVFALVASVLWIVIAWFTGFAIGYVAIVIGAAAGVGMQIGQKGHSTSGGRFAAAMTVVAILFAKIVVIELLLNRQGFNRSIFDLNAAKLGFYLFSPISLIFMAIGMGAAYRAGNGSASA